MVSRNVMISLAVLAVVVILSAVYVTSRLTSAQSVVAGDNISVYYTGAFTNGTVFDTNVGKAPINFTVGAGQLIPGFDQGVIGMKLNQTKTITIPENEAYGPVNPSLFVRVPPSQFSGHVPSVGSIVTRNANGQQVQGVVIAENATNVTVDFNSPLAGQTLIFTIRVVSIKA